MLKLSSLGSGQSHQVVLPSGMFYLHMQNLRGTQAVFDLILGGWQLFPALFKTLYLRCYNNGIIRVPNHW